MTESTELWRAEIDAINLNHEDDEAEVWTHVGEESRMRVFQIDEVEGVSVGDWLIAAEDEDCGPGTFRYRFESAELNRNANVVTESKLSSNPVWAVTGHACDKFFVRQETSRGSFIVPDEPDFDQHERANEEMAKLSARFIVGADEFYFQVPHGRIEKGDALALGDDGLVRKWRQLHNAGRPLRDASPPCRLVWTADGYSKLEPVLPKADVNTAAPATGRCRHCAGGNYGVEHYSTFTAPVYVADPNSEPPGWTHSDMKQANADGHELDYARQAHWIALCEAERSRILLTSRELPWCPHAMRQVELVRFGAALYWHCEHCHGRRAP